MEVRENIIDYINRNQFSKEEISMNTKVSRKKFDKGNKEDLTGEEFLKICAYLKVDPNNFYQKKL